MTKSERPWWYPTLVDDAYLKRLRQDYPDYAHFDDDELRTRYECESKYATLWDDLGDAYDEYEPVADRMLELEKEVERLRELQSATRRYIECCRSATTTPYIKENGRHGKSPWAELIEAAEAEEE